MKPEVLYINVIGEYKPSGVFYCSRCRTVYSMYIQAEQCCCEKYNICGVCGKEADKLYFGRCSDCHNTKEEQDKLNTLNKATEIENDGQPIFTYEGDYHHDLDNLYR